WSTLFPTQPSRPRRLMLYFLIVCLSAVVPLGMELAHTVAAARGEIDIWRASIVRDLQTPRGAASLRTYAGGLVGQRFVDPVFSSAQQRWRIQQRRDPRLRI